MKHTPLYEQHLRDASTVINLKGFARAMHYSGHAAEHRAVRERASLCDVSHMGELEFRGPDALPLVQKVIANDAGRLAVGQALYSVMCDERGMVIDDLVCYRLAADHFVWVVNVTKTDEDYQWVLKHARGMNVTVSNISTDTALLALQGPESREVLAAHRAGGPFASKVLLVHPDEDPHRARRSSRASLRGPDTPASAATKSWSLANWRPGSGTKSWCRAGRSASCRMAWRRAKV